MRLHGEIESMNNLAYTAPIETNNDRYEFLVKEYRHMRIADLRDLEKGLAPEGILDTLDYFFDPHRELSHLAVCQVLDEKTR